MAEMLVPREESHAVPMFSGFTPINQLRPSSAREESTKSSVSMTSKATERSRDTAAEGFLAREKKGKVPSTPAPLKRVRGIRTLERSRKHDISKNFPRTKPRREIFYNVTGQRNKLLTDVAPLLGSSVGSNLPAILGDPLREDGEAISSNRGTYNANLFMNDWLPGLAEKYEAAFDAKLPATGTVSSSSQSFQVSSDTGFQSEFEFAGDVFRYENNDSVQHVTQDMHEHSITSQTFEMKCPSLSDFEPPPSAQIPQATFEEPLAASVLKEHYLAEPGFSSDDHYLDKAFFAVAGELTGIKQGHDPTVQEEPKMSGGMIQHQDFEDCSDGWPDDVSMPDAITIYDDSTQGENEGKPTSGHSDSTRILDHVSGNVIRSTQAQLQSSQDSENDFCDFNESDLESSQISLIPTAKTQQPSTPQTTSHLSSSPNLQWLAPKIFTPMKSQSTVLTQQIDVPHLIPIEAASKHLPFARPPFPKPVLDRSPILGLSNATVLRTCFRIGEALNAAAQGSRSNVDAIIELFARVAASAREFNGGFKQYFQFADLFTDKSPYLSGTSTIWKGVGLWDQDSKVFLGKAGRGKMCRAVGRIKRREEPAGGCEMTVLSVWEVDWEDVGVAKGVVCL